MSLGYRKRKRFAPWLWLNLSTRGVGASVGRRGATVSSKGRLSLGWRGWFWRGKV